MGILSKLFTASAVIFLSGASAFIVQIVRKKIRSLENPKAREAVEAFDFLNINIVTTVDDCDHVVHELRKRSMKHKTLGFDCEWVTSSCGRHPVSMLQLSAFDGYCGLFRLNYFQNSTIPNSLRDLLQCEDIYKIGVAPNGDAHYIRSDYQVEMRATIDVRFIVEMCGYRAGGLAAMSKELLNVTLDKRWKIRCSNWEAVELTLPQVHYAASDAHAAIQIFITVIENFNKSAFRNFWNQGSSEDLWDRIDETFWQYSNRSYKAIHEGRQRVQAKKIKKTQEKEPKRLPNINRKRPLYHNCFLQAPDGELLCTCDKKKALWYMEKELAVLISEDPLTVRLRFEPAARATGDVGKYYQMKKENQCVVCGTAKSNVRKNIVPREYRKYFPEIMKDHSSHDVLLLCLPCHQRSNMQDQVMRKRLADLCDAPIAHGYPKVVEDPALKKIKMAARALLSNCAKHNLPTKRQNELESIVLSHFSDQKEVTHNMLKEAASMEHAIINEDFAVESHGYRVVSKYLALYGGLLKLEEEWRTHFLNTMHPKFMPELWSLHHNRDRLKIKWDEKRLNSNDLKSMGVEW